MDACKLDFEICKIMQKKLSNCAAKLPNYAEKNGYAMLVSAVTGKIVYFVF